MGGIEGCTVVGADIDWLTMSTKPGGSTHMLMDVADSIASTLQDNRGHTREDASWQGYSGFTCGQMFVGARPDGGVIRLSGSSAPLGAQLLSESGLNGKPTRIDYAVTVRFTDDRPEYAQQTAETLATSSDRKTRSRPANVDLHRSFGRGDTCSIGARDSARYLRIYDKTREQQGEVEPNLWRFEVEYKKHLAPRLFQMWETATNRPLIVRRTVGAEFYAQGVLIPWDDDTPMERVKLDIDRPDIERKLHWLRTQVKPTIDHLRRLGRLSEALEALGLPPGDIPV